MVCPAELDQPAPARPTPAADAKITMNASGKGYLAALTGWANGVLALFSDAAAACHAEQAKGATAQ